MLIVLNVGNKLIISYCIIFHKVIHFIFYRKGDIVQVDIIMNNIKQYVHAFKIEVKEVRLSVSSIGRIICQNISYKAMHTRITIIIIREYMYQTYILSVVKQY